jgi:heme-degrading monooxygenase HmoA
VSSNQPPICRGPVATVAAVLEPSFEPPYVAVIFTSVRTDGHDTEYDTMAVAMDALAREQPGFLGVESAREARSRLGITVSYWRTEADAAAWKGVAEHAVAQRLGRARWYEGYRVRVATVTREYADDAPPDRSAQSPG